MGMEKDNEIKKQQYQEGTEFVGEALSNAEMLLEYAAKSGLDIKEDWISTVINARRAERYSDWTAELEIKFWSVYKNMSLLVQPVTVESLRASYSRPVHNKHFLRKLFNVKQKPAVSKRSVRNYLVWAIISMVILLTIQVFSLKGTTLLNNIQNNNRRINEVEDRKRELRLILSSDVENERAKLERFALESERARLDQEISSSIELLEPWVMNIRRLVSFGRETKPLVSAADEPNLASRRMSAGPGGGPPGESFPENKMNKKIAIVQEAQNFTQILQLYILPLLYGLIGGFVFVLRGLAYDIKHRVFSGYSNIKYSLRIQLGALAGLIVGLLWGDIERTQITMLEALSTGAIAFVAGYGVEYVFNALDNLINNLSGKTKSEG
jgi:hypothetical protein